MATIFYRMSSSNYLIISCCGVWFTLPRTTRLEPCTAHKELCNEKEKSWHMTVADSYSIWPFTIKYLQPLESCTCSRRFIILGIAAKSINAGPISATAFEHRTGKHNMRRCTSAVCHTWGRHMPRTHVCSVCMSARPHWCLVTIITGQIPFGCAAVIWPRL